MRACAQKSMGKEDNGLVKGGGHVAHRRKRHAVGDGKDLMAGRSAAMCRQSGEHGDARSPAWPLPWRDRNHHHTPSHGKNSSHGPQWVPYGRM